MELEYRATYLCNSEVEIVTSLTRFEDNISAGRELLLLVKEANKGLDLTPDVVELLELAPLIPGKFFRLLHFHEESFERLFGDYFVRCRMPRTGKKR